MRKINFLAGILILLLLLPGCANTSSDCKPPEQPYLYWKDIDVVVTDVEKRHWFATTHRYEVVITVHSNEYGLDATFTDTGSGAFGCPDTWKYEVGAVTKAKLCSWVMNSTGEVIRRKISQIY